MIGELEPIAAVVARGVAAQLATDRAGMPAQGAGDGAPAPSLAVQHGEGVPFLEGDLGVGHGVRSLGGGVKPSLPQVTSPTFGCGDSVALTM